MLRVRTSRLMPLLATLTETVTDPPARRDLWVDLLARLSMAEAVCTEPETVRYLRQAGVRQTHTIAKNLSSEFEQARRVSRVLGHHITEESLHARRRLLSAQACSLDQEMQALADAYLRLLCHPNPTLPSPLDDWLRQRAEVHSAQADAIQRGI